MVFTVQSRHQTKLSGGEIIEHLYEHLTKVLVRGTPKFGSTIPLPDTKNATATLRLPWRTIIKRVAIL